MEVRPLDHPVTGEGIVERSNEDTYSDTVSSLSSLDENVDYVALTNFHEGQANPFFEFSHYLWARDESLGFFEFIANRQAFIAQDLVRMKPVEETIQEMKELI
mmetsp:Transcript_24981/g.38789  ORF Transcript_24981/g.38789 Transcript_24981/m.38789 type:complete len:103 (+) Transcript_24981:475-783(+)